MQGQLQTIMLLPLVGAMRTGSQEVPVAPPVRVAAPRRGDEDLRPLEQFEPTLILLLPLVGAMRTH